MKNMSASIITDINNLDLFKSYSYADYLNWHFKERLELIKGKIFKMSPAPNRFHQELSIKLSFEFISHFKGKSCKVYTAPFDVRLPIKNESKDKLTYTVLQPDLCIICDLDKLDDRGCVGAPDLVVEILSPSNSKLEMDNKFDVYQESGVKEYWVIYPVERWVCVYFPNEKGEFVSKKPFLEHEKLKSTVFPDMEIDLVEVFKD